MACNQMNDRRELSGTAGWASSSSCSSSSLGSGQFSCQLIFRGGQGDVVAPVTAMRGFSGLARTL